jgi:hypothetical protein
MRDAGSTNNYQVYLKPILGSDPLLIELGAFNLDAFRERADFVGRRSIELVLLEHPLGLADEVLGNVGSQLRSGKKVELKVIATGRQLQECGYLFPVTYQH